MEFDGKVVIVTGSTSGIGEQIALEFAKNGAKVVIHGRDKKRMDTVIEKCTQISPTNQKPLGILADVRDDEQLKKIVDTTVASFSRIDTLVNIAGIGVYVAVDDPKIVEALDDLVRTNLRPVVVLSSLAIPHLVVSKGCIVNISSISSVKPNANYMPNCVCVAAKDMVTRSMALELGPKGVRVNSVQAGFIQTSIYAEMGVVFEEIDDLKKQPLQKFGEPKDVANCVLFLSSSKSAFITGATLLADGGITNA